MRHHLDKNRAPLQCYFKLWASFQCRHGILTGATLRNRQIQVNFLVPCDLEFWWMALKNIRVPLLFYIKLCASFKAIGEFKLESQSGNAQFGSQLGIFVPYDLEIWGKPVRLGKVNYRFVVPSSTFEFRISNQLLIRHSNRTRSEYVLNKWKTYIHNIMYCFKGFARIYYNYFKYKSFVCQYIT